MLDHHQVISNIYLSKERNCDCLRIQHDDSSQTLNRQFSFAFYNFWNQISVCLYSPMSASPPKIKMDIRDQISGFPHNKQAQMGVAYI